ncbi:hypothetical protein BCD64_17750 [Nostoc sp. MBR 210]|nr:hypothetical protein BCD64_17750 [Nostoc sp. MBR 210]
MCLTQRQGSALGGFPDLKRLPRRDAKKKAKVLGGGAGFVDAVAASRRVPATSRTLIDNPQFFGLCRQGVNKGKALYH